MRVLMSAANFPDEWHPFIGPWNRRSANWPDDRLASFSSARDSLWQHNSLYNNLQLCRQGWNPTRAAS